MRFGILGPLEVTDDGGCKLALAGHKQRSVLAILLLHANEVVSRDRVVEEVWPGEPPTSAAKSLQVHVSRLRRAFGRDDRIVTAAGGYLVRVASGELDRDRFERLIEEGTAALGARAWELASGKLREALSLWRGGPLSDFQYDSFAQAEIARLCELHVGAIEQRIEAELALGHERLVIGELGRLVREHPYRERLRGQLMLALYRSGRQAEALEAYRKARATLVEELGIEPSAELRELQEAVLAQEGSLLVPAAEPRDRTAERSTVGARADTGGPASADAPRVEAAPGPREERKVVTILCAGFAGFAARGTLSDPEDLRALLAPYQRSVRAEIERFGGTVEKFMGGEVIALFGAPVAHEDDPERAVRAGLAILEVIAERSEPDPVLDLQARVGIDTGEAVVAFAARPEQGEGLVTGEVINTAARIESAAPVNGVAVGEQTYRATSRLFEFEELSPPAVKGTAELLPLWHAQAARAGFGVDVRRQFKTPFVGRELEKPLLIAAFERAVQQRSVQLVTIVGEPGIGKSRLIAELGAYAHAKPDLTRWRQGRCLPYGEGITFWALGEIIKAEAGILESDPPRTAAQKLDVTVSPEEPERQWLLQRLVPLVGVEAASAAGRQELFTAWRRVLEGLAAARPSVLVFEDLHWADEALLEFLEYLAEWSQGVPLVLLCAARPELYERRPGWGAGQRNSQTINLSPLLDEETAQLISYLTKNLAVNRELERALVDRAGGNPLYAEEFTRLLADRGLDPGVSIFDQAALPDSLQALIAARLDTLSRERKSLLQDAAVVGKVFWEGALAETSGRSQDEVELALHDLARKELVRPVRTSSMEGETEFSFWHVLVRDVAYSQIPRAERARRHRAVAAWIERKAGERVEDLAEVLAHHYLQALELAKASGDTAQVEELLAPARRFLALAGERALGLDTAQAEARLARALELTPVDDTERSVLLARWAEALSQGGRPRESVQALDEALASMRARGQREPAAQALQLRSRLAIRLAEGRQVVLAAEAVELLEQSPAGPALVEAYAQLANAQAIAGAHAQAIAAADRAQALAKSLDLPEPARALGYRGFARAYLGDPDGLAEAHRAHTLLVDAGAGRDAAFVLNNLALAEYPVMGPERSLATFEEGIAFCEQRGLVEAAANLEGNCPGLLVELGRPVEAAARAARLAPVLESSGDTHDLIEIRAVELVMRTARGEQGPRPEVDWIVSSAQTLAATDISIYTLTAAAAALAEAAPERSHELIAELERVPGAREDPYYARQLSTMLRTVLAADGDELANRLVEGLHAHYPLGEHALVSARAQLAEHAGENAEAANLYGEAAARWQRFGNVPERAYALLGEGRCLLALDRAEGQRPLREARDLFASMGYKPARAKAEALLDQMPAASG